MDIKILLKLSHLTSLKMLILAYDA